MKVANITIFSMRDFVQRKITHHSAVSTGAEITEGTRENATIGGGTGSACVMTMRWTVFIREGQHDRETEEAEAGGAAGTGNIL